jgi:rhodanese-related sulfurtransferase
VRGVAEITVEELDARLRGGAPTLLVDVRQPWEHEICALPDSLLAPLGELTEHVEDIQPDPGALVVVYCHHGIRSLSGAAILMRQGIEGAVSLAGGIDAWSRRIDPSVPLY